MLNLHANRQLRGLPGSVGPVLLKLGETELRNSITPGAVRLNDDVSRCGEEALVQRFDRV